MALRLDSALRCVLLAWLILLPYAASAATARARDVLMLFSNGRLLPANVEFDRGMSEVFAAHPEARVDLSVEFLDAPKFSGATYEKTLANYLREKYATHPPEVIIVAGEIALDFVLATRERMFPDTPVVYQAVNTSHLPKVLPLPGDVIGVAWQYDFPGTVELALRWHPQARRLVVVTGTAPWDRDWETLARKESKALNASLEIEFLAGLSADALKQRLGQLGGDTVVFTPGYFRDGDGRLSTPKEAARLIASATDAPVYGPFPTFVGTGIVGGVMASYVTMGRQAADTALALFGGMAPAAVALPKITPNHVHVDWRQARRFGIPPEVLTTDAVVSFREPSFWEAYRGRLPWRWRLSSASHC